MEKELLEKLEGLIKTAKDFTGGQKGNFLSVSLDFKDVKLHAEYTAAKNFVDAGGYVLVIDKKKVYSYKEKNEEEYMKYLKYQIKKENFEKMNYYGL